MIKEDEFLRVDYLFQNKFHAPSSSMIEMVAESSGGDIRSALNTLQFACTRGLYEYSINPFFYSCDNNLFTNMIVNVWDCKNSHIACIEVFFIIIECMGKGLSTKGQLLQIWAM